MTIYALSSGLGTSGIAVIRVSGTDTKNVIKSIVTGKLPPPRVATLKKIYKFGSFSIFHIQIIIQIQIEQQLQLMNRPRCYHLQTMQSFCS